MIEDDGLRLFSSPLDSNISVMIVYPHSSRYESVSAQFKKSGHAFILHEAKTVVIDGSTVDEPWFTSEHLMVIQAHEIGHYRAGHAITPPAPGVDIEKEADWIGHQLLGALGYKSAAELHQEEYTLRYGNHPDDDSLHFEKKLRKFVH